MQVAVLCSKDSWYFTDLWRAAGMKLSVRALAFTQLCADVANDESTVASSGGVQLEGFDAVLVRTMPPGSLEQVVFRMDVLGRLEAGGVTVINPPRAIEAAVDKYLATAKLQAAGLTVPETIVCQTSDDSLAAFEKLGGDVVVKPLFGSEGRGITRVSDENLALRAFRMLEQLGAVIYLQRFVEHEGFDIRLLIIGESVLAMRRRNAHDWRTNVSRGATAEAFVPDDALVGLARRAADAIGAPLAGVDLLPGRDGGLYVLEVNAVPGWKALSRVLDVDVARMVLDFVEARVRSKSPRPLGEG